MTKPDSIADRLNHAYTAAQARPPHTRCSISKLLEKIDNTDRQALTAALNDDEFPNRAIADALGIAPHTVRRHRRGDCACNRKAIL